MSSIDPDPTLAARKIACVLLGLVEPDTAKVLAAASVDRGEPWLYDHWRKHLSDDQELTVEQRRRLMRIGTHAIDSEPLAAWERELLARQEDRS